MSPDVERSIEERLHAALNEVAESVNLDQQPAMWPDDTDTRRRTRGPRALAMAGIAVVLAIGVAVAVKAATSGVDSRRHVPASNTRSTTSASSTLGLSAEEQAFRNHPRKAGPFPDLTGVIDPKSIQHHSGGPYLTPRQAADIVLNTYDCRLGGPAGSDANSTCVQVDVRFFDHYANFWAVEGGQTQFVGAWGPDREMYVVTIFGKLPFVTTSVNRNVPDYVPDRTYQIDATTGQVLMTGGYPLPEGSPGIRTFRSP